MKKTLKKTWLVLALALMGGVLLLCPAFGEAAGQDQAISRRLVAGAHHAAAILSDGTVAATGENADGQCDVSAWKDIVALAAGEGHTVGLKSDGTVVAVGRNDQGQCEVSAWRDILWIAAGAEHTVGLKSDGTVVAAGNREIPKWYGEQETADPCGVGAWRDVALLAAGGHSTFAVTKEGRVLTAGCLEDEPMETIRLIAQEEDEETPEFLTLPEMPRQIALLGDEALLVLYADGTTDYWGLGSQLYPAEWGYCSHCNPGIDAAMNGNPHTYRMWTDIVALSAGDDFVLGLRADGTVVAAGDYAAADAGYSLHAAEEWENIVALAVGGDYALGVESDGTVRYAAQPTGDMGGVAAWKGVQGASANALLAAALDENGTPVLWSCEETLWRMGDFRAEARHWRNLARLSVGESVIAGVDRDGKVYAAGGLSEEELSRLRQSPAVRQAVAGGERVLVLEETGTVALYAGDAAEWDLAPLAGAVEIALGENHAVGRMADGTVRAVGEGLRLQCRVADWQGIIAIAAAGNATYGLKVDGTVVATGDLSLGQAAARSWTQILAISASPYHVVGLRADGTVVAAGVDTDYEPDGDWGDLGTRYQCRVSHWTDVKSIVAGVGCTLGVQTDGTVLLAGMGHVDISAARDWRLFNGRYARRDAPLTGESENLARIAERKSAYAEEAETVRAFLTRLTPEARAVRAQHPEYERMYNFSGGVAVFFKEGLYGLVNQAGEEILPASSPTISRARGTCVFYDPETECVGFYVEDTQALIPAQFWAANDFEGEYANVDTAQGEMYVSRRGQVISPEAYQALGLAPWTAPEPTLSLYVQKDLEVEYEGEYGYQDENGKVVIAPLFDLGYDFVGNVAEVWLWGGRGVIDERGYALCGFETAWELLEKNGK